MAYTINRRLADLITSTGVLETGKIPADYITNAHIADNTLTAAQLHTTFAVGSAHIPANLITIAHLAVTDGTANQVLKTDGSGALSFTTIEADKIQEGNSYVEVTDTGSNGTITMRTEGTDRWEVTSAGHILPLLDDTYDIGSASKKVRDIYVSDGSIKMGADTVLSINSDGDFEINDAAGAPKKLRVDEIEIGTGTDKIILKKGSDGKLESREKKNGVLQTARKQFQIGVHGTGEVTEGSNLYFTNARARSAISATGSLSYNSSTGVMSFTMPAQNTSNITEGSNLYYTDARVDTRLVTRGSSNWNTAYTVANAALPKTGGALTGAVTTNSTFDGRNVSVDGTKLDGIAAGANNYTLPSGYATETYVGTQISALVDSSPAALNTLNELAAALGDDPNFATTVSNTIGTKWTQNNTKLSQWDTAYGWGNHASGGYAPVSTTVTTNTTQTISGNKKFTGTNVILDTAANSWKYIRLQSAGSVKWDIATNEADDSSSLQFRAAGGGTNRVTVSQAGNLTATGTVTATGGNSTNWNTAYGWGNHSGVYLPISGKAADSNKLDNIDSTGFVKQLSNTSSGPNYFTPSSRRVDPHASNPTNAHYAISTFGNGGNVTGQLATHLSSGEAYTRGYNSSWSSWRKVHDSVNLVVGAGGLTQQNFTTTLKNKLDGIAASANNYTIPSTVVYNTNGFNVTQRQRFSANQTHNWDTIATGTGSQGSLEVFNTGAGNDAFMAFHAGGDYAGYFGLDADTNDLAWGGWSVGAVKHKMFHAGNSTQFTSALNSKLAGIAASANNYSLPSNVILPSSGSLTTPVLTMTGVQNRTKLRVWDSSTYGMGMHNAHSFGGLNDYAMTFQMNNDSDRGFWWGDDAHTNAQGAMSLTTNGKLSVASGIRVGYGETDTTTPAAGLAVNGTASFAGVIDANGGHGGINITSTSILSAASSTWTGDPGGAGKIQYHSNRWYIVSDSSSNRIVQFRRNGSDKSYIDNNGLFVGNVSGSSGSCTGNAATVTQNHSDGGGNYPVLWRSSGTTYYTDEVYITASTNRLRASILSASNFYVGSGENDGRFYSDTPGRTAFASGDFYIQTSVANCYLYPTNLYLGNSSGTNSYFRSNNITGTNWGITAAGAATFATIGGTFRGGTHTGSFIGTATTRNQSMIGLYDSYQNRSNMVNG